MRSSLPSAPTGVLRPPNGSGVSCEQPHHRRSVRSLLAARVHSTESSESDRDRGEAAMRLLVSCTPKLGGLSPAPSSGPADPRRVLSRIACSRSSERSSISKPSRPVARFASSAACRGHMGAGGGGSARALLGFGSSMAASTQRKSTGTKRTALAAKSSRSSGSSRDSRRRFVVCLSNDGYAASLEVRKIYTTLSDATALKLGLLRVVDESGEDYLYPCDQFGEIELSPRIAKAIATGTGRRSKS
jgi:hypothetical protein